MLGLILLAIAVAAVVGELSLEVVNGPLVPGPSTGGGLLAPPLPAVPLQPQPIILPPIKQEPIRILEAASPLDPTPVLVQAEPPIIQPIIIEPTREPTPTLRVLRGDRDIFLV
jgi:hypothetical protein